MKGIVLAGGNGTRLYPMTKGVSKQLLPVYDKPMIYYPLSVLMLAGIREILIISTPHDLHGFRRLLGTGEELGIEFSYVEQPSPDGLAQAFLLGEEFVGDDAAALVLGDNIFYGQGFTKMLTSAVAEAETGRATIFGYCVNNPEMYGVADIDEDMRVVGLEEKPRQPRSNYAVTGLYFYPAGVVGEAKKVRPSGRGELEITDLNKLYMDAGTLRLELLSRGFAWLDTGTPHSLSEAGTFIEVVEKRQGVKVACLEEIAFRKGWITREQLLSLAEPMKNTEYGKYIVKTFGGEGK